MKGKEALNGGRMVHIPLQKGSSVSKSNARMKISKESTIQLNRSFNLDWRGLWVIAIAIANVAIATIASFLGVFVIAGFFFVVTVVLGIVLLFPFLDNMQTSLITKIFMKAQADLGENTFASDEHKYPEVLGGDTRKRRLPKIAKRLGKVEFYPYKPEGDPEDSILGIAKDNTYGGTLSARFDITNSSLLSDDDLAQLDRLEFFSTLLDRFAEPGNAISRFSWQVQTTMGRILNPAHIVQRVREDAGFNANPLLDVTTLFRRMEEMGLASPEHSISFTFTVDPKNLGQQVRRAGSVEEVLVDQLAEFVSALQMGNHDSPLGVKTGHFLDYNQLLLSNRQKLDPIFAHPVIQRMKAARKNFVFASQRPAWPKYFDFKNPKYARVGETIHMGYYIDEMPSQGMTPTQLWGILSLQIPKTVTVIFNMLPIRQAEKRAQMVTRATRTVNRDMEKADAQPTRAQIRAEEALDQYEDEMALNLGQDGRVRVYIDVTGATVEEAEANSLLLRNVALASRFMIESLEGRQQEGIEVLMPVGRGLVTLPLKK